MKKCTNKARRNHRRTKDGFLSNLFYNQKGRSKRKNLGEVEYTLSEFKEFVLSENVFHQLFKKWEESGFKMGESPSIDRLDDYKPYSLSNIRITTWDINNKKGHKDRKSGINNKVSKAIIQTNLNGIFENEFYSIREAGRILGIHNELIGSVCRGKRSSYKGFIYKYKEG